ncbi:putative ribonuclease [Neolecta irregularis DAH-3]|uniref:Putative ribonuclease n=1 Tax=Neolecta irregularis (strain DAH-3) TaxID=1198029 RepID=A0A1U7LLN0_NEOID|nr:putative ribonuclease [Neolecta irregularis DAH-3]|eukprot:OLL23538.1 putative ribonuclease [Neolecta irregularis DAH-3]
MFRPSAKSTYACLRCQIRQRTKSAMQPATIDGVSFRNALRQAISLEPKNSQQVYQTTPQPDPFGRTLRQSAQGIILDNTFALSQPCNGDTAKDAPFALGAGSTENHSARRQVAFREKLAQSLKTTIGISEEWCSVPFPDVGEVSEESAVLEIKPGDLVEIRRGNGVAVLAIRIPFTKVTDMNIKAYLTTRAKTIYQTDWAVSFRIPGFVSPEIAEKLGTDDCVPLTNPYLSRVVHPLRKFDTESWEFASTKIGAVESVHDQLTAKKITTLEMAETLFGKDPSPQMIYATHLLLMRDRKRFVADPTKMRQSMTFDVRPSKRVVNMEKVTMWIREMTSEVTSFIVKANRVVKNRKSEKWCEEDKLIIEYFKAYILERKQLQTSLFQSYVPSILRRIDDYQSKFLDRGMAFQFLKDIGIFSNYENHDLQDPKVNIYPFSGEIGKLFDTITHRETIRRRVYIIDAPDAKELDDAISYENVEGKEWIHIHIANPTAYMPQNSPVALDARNRASTIYLPEITVPMLPEEIATGIFSLQKGSPVLTFSARINNDGEVIDYKISHGVLQNVKQITYDQLDHLLAGLKPAEQYEWFVGSKKPSKVHFQPAVLEKGEIETLKAIQKFAQRILERRIRDGFVSFDNPAYIVSVSPNPLYPTHHDSTISKFSQNEPVVSLKVAHECGLSRPAGILVSELMILGGQIVARYCNQYNIPNAYRTQGLSQEPEFMTEYHNALRKRNSVGLVPTEFALPLMKYLKPVMLSLKSGRHEMLAIDCYTKATSPLRRFGDMVVHYQLDAHLSNQILPFTTEQIQKEMNPLAWRESAVNNLSRMGNKHWICQLLNRLSGLKDFTFEGMIYISNTADVPVPCLAKELGTRVEVSGIPLADKHLGRRLKFRIQDVDLFQHSIHGEFIVFI